MSNETITNPFIHFGGKVAGPRFIGRRQALRAIENSLFASLPRCFAIVGARHTGKSSLVLKGIVERKDELISKRVVPVWIDLKLHNSPDAFFQSLVEQSYYAIETLRWETAELKRLSEEVCSQSLELPLNFVLIKNFFKKVAEQSIYMLCILDEFDYTCELFKNSVTNFARLRSLGDESDCGIAFVTTSRRSLNAIEEQTGAISTLDNIFQKYYLSLFDELELAEYFTRLESVVGTLNKNERQKILAICGSHPYLLDMLGYEIVEVYFEKISSPHTTHSAKKEKHIFEKLQKFLFKSKLDQEEHSKVSEPGQSQKHFLDKYIDEAIIRTKKERLDFYEKLLGDLRLEETLEQFLELISNTNHNIKPNEIETFLKYGLIIVSQSDTYAAFSPHFQMYLSPRLRNTNIHSSLKPGDLVGDNYEIIEEIKQGASSNSYVFTALDHAVDKRVVFIKEPAFFRHHDYLDDTTFQRLFNQYQREIKILARIQHSYIAQVYNFVDQRYMVQEWVKGESLRSVIKTRKKLPLEKILKIAEEACQALGNVYTQEGIIHRDIKPEHIFLAEDNHVRIIDFGLARTEDRRLLSRSSLFEGKHSISGTPAYMPPEQALGEEDHRADIFAFGMTLYELITFKRAYPLRPLQNMFFTREVIPPPVPLKKYRPDAPKQLERCIMKAIRIAVEERYATWKDFENAITNIKHYWK